MVLLLLLLVPSTADLDDDDDTADDDPFDAVAIRLLSPGVFMFAGVKCCSLAPSGQSDAILASQMPNLPLRQWVSRITVVGLLVDFGYADVYGIVCVRAEWLKQVSDLKDTHLIY